MKEQTHSEAAGYLLLVVGATILIGMTGYYFGFLGFVYDVMMPNAFGRFDLFTLAMITGLAAFFSPCAFPLLPSYVAYSLTPQEKQEPKDRLHKSLYLGMTAALGLTLVNLIVGLAAAALGATFFQPDPRLDHPMILATRIAAGLTVVALGALTLAHRSFSIGSAVFSRLTGQALNQEKASYGGVFAYGMLYNGVGIGCTGPILLSLVLYTLTIGNFITAITGFAIFSLTMAILMLLITTLVGLSKAAAIGALKRISPSINRVSAVVMMTVGIFTVALTGNEFFTRIFFPFLPARPITASEILWVGVTLAALPVFLGYIVLRKK